MRRVTVIGGGLAGSEAAWQLARRGYAVDLCEMRPDRMTPAHTTGLLGELVCSNSLGASETDSPGGILKAEMKRLGSLVLEAAEATSVPAGRALAVDRNLFAGYITDALSNHPNIHVTREECTTLPEGPSVIATGPLTSDAFAQALRKRTGGFLSFFDAVAPVVATESLEMDKIFRGSRWGKGEDYLNCPMNEEEYRRFWMGLVAAEKAPRHAFERDQSYFEGCLPVEVIAGRGVDTLRFGPMRPVGLADPRTGREPYAVVQLRQDNREGTLYNLVGFQTNLRFGEQERIFRLIPGLERAEFARLGVMHRNIYVNAPLVLDPALRLRDEAHLFLAGQITGVEGYAESTATGLAAALHLHAQIERGAVPSWPRETALGSLLGYLQSALPDRFQPMNCNLGIFPPLEKRIKKKQERCREVAAIALRRLEAFLSGEGEIFCL